MNDIRSIILTYDNGIVKSFEDESIPILISNYSINYFVFSQHKRNISISGQSFIKRSIKHLDPDGKILSIIIVRNDRVESFGKSMLDTLRNYRNIARDKIILNSIPPDREQMPDMSELLNQIPIIEDQK